MVYVDRHLQIEIKSLSRELPVRAYVDGHIQVSVGSASVSRAAHAAQAEALPVVDARGNLDRLLQVLANAPGAAAVRAGIGDHLAGAFAGRARARGRKGTENRALLRAHLSRAVAGFAGDRLGARLCAGTVAGFAGFLSRDGDLFFHAKRRFFKRDGQVIAQDRRPESGRCASVRRRIRRNRRRTSGLSISPKSPNPPNPPPANGSCPPMLGSNAAWPY